MGWICISFGLQQKAKAVAILLGTFSIVSTSVYSASSCVVADNCLQSDAAADRSTDDGAGTASLAVSPVPSGNTLKQQITATRPAFMPEDQAFASAAGARTKIERFWPAGLARGRSRAGTAMLDLTALALAGAAVLTLTARRKYRELKRYTDVIASILLLSAFSPLMLLIALLVKIDSPGPVLIKQVRVGLNRRKRKTSALSERRQFRNYGSLFLLYKFRTMRADAEAKTGPVWASRNDDRITRFGALLRKTHLDELPQFVNVLRGDMCIIGPRPERPVFTEQLNSHIRNYEKRLQVKPGITGLAQVRYRYAASIADTRKKLRYDLLYIKKMCILMDMRILFNTFNMLMTTDKGAR